MKQNKYTVMATLRVYKRNSTFIDESDLAEEISRLGLNDALLKYYSKPLEKEAKSIVAGPKLLAVLKQIISNSNIVRRYHTI